MTDVGELMLALALAPLLLALGIHLAHKFSDWRRKD